MEIIIILFISFILYSIIGWTMEMVITASENKKFINRGFLIGPYCPVYGVGAIFIVTLLDQYSNDLSALFVLAVVICSIVEYTTSYLMEKIFKARWWDYSKIPFNINGRICLSNSILFGFGGIVIIKINPFIFNMLASLPNLYLGLAFGLLFSLFIIDVSISFSIINKLKLSVLNAKKDYTDEISEKVKQMLISKSSQFKRLLLAFPDMVMYGGNKIKKRKFWFNKKTRK